MGQGDSFARERGPDLHHRPARRPWRCWPNPSSADAAPRRVRSKDLGEDPVTKRHVVVRSGRFGLYVTDGEVNATLRLGDTPETITLDRPCELLAERRNAEPSSRASGPEEGGGAKKAPAKKTAAKKTAAKKTTAKKTAAKKATGAAKRAATAAGAAANAVLAARADHD